VVERSEKKTLVFWRNTNYGMMLRVSKMVDTGEKHWA